MGIAVLKGPKLIIEYANSAYRKLVGENRPLDGLPMEEAFNDIGQSPLDITWQSYKTGERMVIDRMSVTANWEGTSEYEKIFSAIYEPLMDVNHNQKKIFVRTQSNMARIIDSSQSHCEA